MAKTEYTNKGETFVTSGGTGTPPASGTTEQWTVDSWETFPMVSDTATPRTKVNVCDSATGYGSEIIEVYNVNGTTIDVVRGADATTPIQHASNFTIQEVVTKSDYAQLLVTEWFNVKTMGGCKGDGVTDDTTALNASIAGCPDGGTLYFPAGVYVTSSPIKLTKSGMRLFGPNSAQNSANGWGAAGDYPGPGDIIYDYGATLKPSVSFAQGGATMNAVLWAEGTVFRQIIENIWIDGTNLTTGTNGTVHAIGAYGAVKATLMRGVGILGMTGSGVYNLTGTGGSPSAGTCTDMIVQSCLGHGFYDYFDDGFIQRCHSQCNGGDGYHFENGSPLMANCRADMSGGDGVYWARTPGTGKIYNLWTERNQHHGVHITTKDAAGDGPGMVTLTGAHLQADGVNGDAGGGSYAGLFIEGSVAVTASDLVTEVQTYDVASPGCPQYAVRMAQYGTNNRAPTAVMINGGLLTYADTNYAVYGGQVPLVRNYRFMCAQGAQTVAQAYHYVDYDSGTYVYA